MSPLTIQIREARASCLKSAGISSVELRHMRLFFKMLAGFACVFALASAPALAGHCYPSSSSPEATSAFEQGTVDGHWVGLVIDYRGGNGGAYDAIVYTMRVGGNGLLLHPSGKIKAEGQYADRLGALFANNKLYIVNAVYLPGEAHCCYTHDAVQRFGFQGDELVQEGIATVDLSHLGHPKLITTNGHTCVDDRAYRAAWRRAILATHLSP